MTVTLDLISAFVACRYKAYLKCIGKTGNVTEYEILQREVAGDHGKNAAQWYAQRFEKGEVLARLISHYDALSKRCQLVLEASSEKHGPCVAFPAIERLAEKRAKHTEHGLVVSAPNVKLSGQEKLGAAVLALAISRRNDVRVTWVKIIHGLPFSITKVAMLSTKGPTRVAEQSATVLHDLEALVGEPAPPPMYLNDHCGICEYQSECRPVAVDRDDLSLLRGLQPKEIDAWKKRGIFTVTQLAYTFRAKTMGRNAQQHRRHSQPLQAMAIRDKKTYVATRPEMPTQPTKVFFDVEGVPERDCFYLVGAVVVEDGMAVPHQCWADDESRQEGMWNDFVGLLAGLGDYVLVHYGRYDRDFIRKMRQRYGGDDFTPRLFDVHGAVRSNVYFPSYTNSLKEIASLLGFRWQGPVRSGIDSIVWRHKWEKSGESQIKEDLFRYNHEDCLALMAVFDHLVRLSYAPDDNACVEDDGDGLPESRGVNFGKNTFALPAMKTITKCAYFDYQQQKVFFRTDKHVRRSLGRKRHSSKATVKVNTVMQHGQPEKCPRCMSPIKSFGRDKQTKTVRDLKFFRGGVKRWIIRHSTARYACQSCNHTFYSPSYPTKQPMFGHGVASWAVYQHVALCQSYESVTASVNDAFGYTFSTGMVKRSHQQLAVVHAETERVLLERLRTGAMICADEAKIKIRGAKTGYVWAFSGPEVVIYRFNDSRDGTVMNEVLGDFSGVLVSDFYGVYDSVSCSQQKCIVHLIRDINDDLLRSPFDEELKELAVRFTALMTAIVECIDRYGLTQRHLRKFVRSAEKYRTWIADQRFVSGVAQGYQKRIGKYGDRLFTFLSHDGVPWNNNIAENAVKLIVSRRKTLDGLMSRGGIKDYLIFLSIYQTLRRKGGSFLRFLLSGKTDVFEFLGE